MTSGQVVLDASALIALERGDAVLRGYVALAGQGDISLWTSSAVVAQVWRGGARQARLSRFLASDLVIERALDAKASRRIGLIAATTGAVDVVDGHVALLALDLDAIIVTSDPGDLERWGIDKDRIVRC